MPRMHFRNGAYVPFTQAEEAEFDAMDTVHALAVHAGTIRAVKAEAARRILAIMPEWKQRNTMAFGLEMALVHGANPASWPQDMQDRYAADIAAWRRIKAIRAASDLIEAQVPPGAEADGFDVVNREEWPE